MKSFWHKQLLGNATVLLIATVLVISAGCKEASTTEPTTNVPVVAAQPLTMSGFVKETGSGNALAGASVKIGKVDGTLLTTVSSGSDGKYTYDASSVTDTVLIAGATLNGYGFASVKAKIVKASNNASVPDLQLTKIVAASAPVTPAAGGTVTAPAQTGVSTAPTTVTVPPNAVASNVTLTAAPIAASQVPPPTTANTTVMGAAQFGPSGTTFSVPVTVSIPLTVTMTPGRTFPLQVLNETTGQYSNSGFTATVSADGKSATAPVTHFSTYTVFDVVTLTINAGTIVPGTLDYVELSSGSTFKYYTAGSGSMTVTGGNLSAGVVLTCVYNATLDTRFVSAYTGSAAPFLLQANFPTLPSAYQSGGVQVNPNAPGTTGSWSYRWYVQQQTTPYTGNLVYNGATTTFTASVTEYVLLPQGNKTGWYWTAHNQGTVTGPF